MPPRNSYVEIDGLRELHKKLENLESGFGSKKLMSDISFFTMLAIKKRTAEGKDVDGVTFTPYSPVYKLFRAKKGHPVSKVDLFFTGSMMSSMTFTASSKQTRIYFANTADKSKSKNPLKAFFLNQRREFFAMSDKEVSEIVQMVEDHIAAKLLETK